MKGKLAKIMTTDGCGYYGKILGVSSHIDLQIPSSEIATIAVTDLRTLTVYEADSAEMAEYNEARVNCMLDRAAAAVVREFDTRFCELQHYTPVTRELLIDRVRYRLDNPNEK